MAEELQVTDLFLDYALPDRLIAQHPAARRDDARLLVLQRDPPSMTHRVVRELPDILSPGDLLVLNDTRVLPARLIGRRVKTGGNWESLFLREHEGLWELMARTRGYPHPGEVFQTDSGLTLQLMDRTADRHWLMKPETQGTPAELLALHGHVPLPPYIRKGQDVEDDGVRYQTVYARVPGSVAAPTAGLHFTPELLSKLKERGIHTTTVTLHVGIGTFTAMTVSDPNQHTMHEEWCEVGTEAVAAIASAKAAGGRVIAVGTTAARALETAARGGTLTPYRGPTRIFIHPPFGFQVINGLLTNFHLPRTTLLLLVQSLTGAAKLKSAYEEAIRQEYRFFSYGDTMLVI